MLVVFIVIVDGKCWLLGLLLLQLGSLYKTPPVLWLPSGYKILFKKPPLYSFKSHSKCSCFLFAKWGVNEIGCNTPNLCSVAQRSQSLYSKCLQGVNCYPGWVRAHLCGSKSCSLCELCETQIFVILQVIQARNEQSSHVQVQVDRCAWGC